MTSQPNPSAPPRPGPPRAGTDAIRSHLTSLRAQGGTYRSIAQAAGLAPTTVHGIATGRTHPREWTTIAVLTVTSDALSRARADAGGTRLRDAVIVVYDAWWDKRAPERTRRERAAATTARRRATTGNWCAAAALDDDELDIPGYQPAYGWRPARGTGTAPAFPRPVLQRPPRNQRTGRPA